MEYLVFKWRFQLLDVDVCSIKVEASPIYFFNVSKPLNSFPDESNDNIQYEPSFKTSSPIFKFHAKTVAIISSCISKLKTLTLHPEKCTSTYMF